MILPEKDPIGRALSDLWEGKEVEMIKVVSDVAEDETLDPHYFFRSYEEMPKLEQLALDEVRGRVLDVGAGAGCHALELEKRGLEVIAIDISKLAVSVMEKRGVNNPRLGDIFEVHEGSFDTILLMMNGVGIAQTLDGLQKMLTQCKKLLAPGGQILLDSSDIIYLFEDEEGAVYYDLNASKYYGEVTYQLRYNDVESEPFGWLYAGAEILEAIAQSIGYHFEILKEGPHYDYLARLTI